MTRRWSGTIAIEGRQTGDGRVIAAGALTWDEVLPMPLEWNPDSQGSHDEIVVVGMVETVERQGELIVATGVLDDEGEYGQEVVRLMQLTPPHASGVSLVLDNVAVELVDQSGITIEDPTEEPMDEPMPVEVVASGAVIEWGRKTTVRTGAAGLRALFAAAGEPDPVNAPVIMEDAADVMIERCVRGRLRALTLVDVPAFVECSIMLEADPAQEPPVSEPGEPPVAEEPADEEMPVIAASAAYLSAPPRAWFTMDEPSIGDDMLVEQIDPRTGVVKGHAVPLTITDDGQVFGHVSYWGQCHIGYGQQCVPPPISEEGYSLFHTGLVRTAEGDELPVGALVVDADHAAESMAWARARDAYAHTGLGWADVRVTNGEHGIWACGALRPELTPAQIRVLRASKLSGDWRTVPGFTGLQMVGVLAVNNGGFSIARHALAASGLAPAKAAVTVEYGDDGIERMTGINMVASCSTCQEPLTLTVEPSDDWRAVLEFMRSVDQRLGQLELRTRHLRTAAKDELRARIRRAV